MKRSVQTVMFLGIAIVGMTGIEKLAVKDT